DEPPPPLRPPLPTGQAFTQRDQHHHHDQHRGGGGGHRGHGGGAQHAERHQCPRGHPVQPVRSGHHHHGGGGKDLPAGQLGPRRPPGVAAGAAHQLGDRGERAAALGGPAGRG